MCSVYRSYEDHAYSNISNFSVFSTCLYKTSTLSKVFLCHLRSCRRVAHMSSQSLTDCNAPMDVRDKLESSCNHSVVWKNTQAEINLKPWTARAFLLGQGQYLLLVRMSSHLKELQFSCKQASGMIIPIPQFPLDIPYMGIAEFHWKANCDLSPHHPQYTQNKPLK